MEKNDFIYLYGWFSVEKVNPKGKYPVEYQCVNHDLFLPKSLFW